VAPPETKALPLAGVYVVEPTYVVMGVRGLCTKENIYRLYAPLVNPWALYNNAGPQPVLLDWSENP